MDFKSAGQVYKNLFWAIRRFILLLSCIHLFTRPLSALWFHSAQTDETRTAAVEAAVAEVQHILQGSRGPPPKAPSAVTAAIPPPANIYPNTLPYAPPPVAPQPAAPAPSAVTPLMVFVNVPPAPPEFNLSEKIKGPGEYMLCMHTGNDAMHA